MTDYCEKLVAYVMGFGGKTREQAEGWLDEQCPAWRLGELPVAGVISVHDDEVPGDD